MKLKTKLFAAILTSMMMPVAAQADPVADAMRTVYDGKIQPWLSQGVVVDAIKTQNTENAGLSDAQAKAIDDAWRAAKGGDHYSQIMAKECSKFILDKQNNSDGLIVEMFIVGLKGLNVCQSILTSDVLQGDEPKFQVPMQGGVAGELIEEPEWDDEVGSFVRKISRTITDPANSEVIGTITAAIVVDKL